MVTRSRPFWCSDASCGRRHVRCWHDVCLLVTSAENGSPGWHHCPLQNTQCNVKADQPTELLARSVCNDSPLCIRRVVFSQAFQSAALQMPALAALACRQKHTCTSTFRQNTALGSKPAGSTSHLQTLFLKNLFGTLSAHLLCLFPSGLVLVANVQTKLLSAFTTTIHVTITTGG